MKRRFQVFVSSTFADLVDERQQILHTLVELGCFPAGMELFPAASADAWSHIAAIIDDSDYYVLVVGNRYGSLTPDGISFTEAEYDYAVEHKPVFVFLHEDPDSLPVKRSDIDPALRRRLAEFRGKLEARHLCKYWRTGADLANAIVTSLAHAFESDPGLGWVRPEAGSDPRAVRRSSGFEVVKHSELLRLTQDGFECDISMTIQAIHPGLEVFYRQTAGSGHTSFVDAEVISAAATMLRPMISLGDAVRYWIHLGRQLIVGEETLVQIREAYHEAARDAESMHAYYVNHGVQQLELFVEYPPDRVPKSAVWREYAGDPSTGDVVDGGDLEIDPGGGLLTFQRAFPSEGSTYAIEWAEEPTPAS